MKTYFANNTIQFFDAVEKIKTEDTRDITITITNDVNHCHLMRFITDREICIIGYNSPKYQIYLDPKEISSNPKWQFNSTLFFYTNNCNISYSNLHFTYIIEKYDFISSTLNITTDNTTETINLKDDQILNSFDILLMEFYNSKVGFKGCTFENNTNRTFEIVIQEQSLITFESCTFKGEFKFTIDINSKVIIY